MELMTKLRKLEKCHQRIAVYQVGGRGGIRTHGWVTPTPDFESGAFNHSATLPAIDYQGFAALSISSHFSLVPGICIP